MGKSRAGDPLDLPMADLWDRIDSLIEQLRWATYDDANAAGNPDPLWDLHEKVLVLQEQARDLRPMEAR